MKISPIQKIFRDKNYMESLYSQPAIELTCDGKTIFATLLVKNPSYIVCRLSNRKIIRLEISKDGSFQNGKYKYFFNINKRC